MRRTNVLLLAVALAVVAALSAWLWTFSPVAPAEEEEPPALASSSSAADREPAAEHAVLESGETELDGDDALEPVAADEPFERAELASAEPTAAEAEVAAGPRAHVRGALVDEATGEPLPRFLLRVHDRTHQEDVWTDASGRFESRTGFLAGRLRIDPLDHPERKRPAPSLQIEHELESSATAGTSASARELALAVPSGPTWFVRIEPEGELVLTTAAEDATSANERAGPGERAAGGASADRLNGNGAGADASGVGANRTGTSAAGANAAGESGTGARAAGANEAGANGAGARDASGNRASTNASSATTSSATASSAGTAADASSSSDASARSSSAVERALAEAAAANAGRLTLDTARLNLLVTGEEARDRVGGEALRPPAPDDAFGLPWVRFGPIDPRYERAERLELRSTDGLWRADTNVGALRGVQAAPVTLKVEAYGAIAGVVLDADGLAVPRAQVFLREGSANAPRERRRDTTTDAHGRFRFDFVRPGEGVVGARTLRHAPNEAPVVIRARETSAVELALLLKPPAGPIRGEIVTETGRSTPKARVRLVESGARGGPALEADVRWTTVEGRKVGRFEFTALPAGTFTLSIEKDDWLKWEPRSLEVTAPREDVRIVVRDDVATCDYVVRARDRDNGLVLDGLRVWVEFQNGPSRERRAASGEPIERGVPLERTFRWRIDAPGYGSVRGDEKAFALEEHVDGRIRRVLEVALEPGWADVVRAVRRDGRSVIEGVEVFVDGRSVGKTGKDGNLKVELRDPPKTLEAKHPNWVLAGKADLRVPWKRDERKFVLLRFNPVPKKRK
ncbi:MAG: carboxypeptidase regulatory-like domain-containing protein [Planctomycetes bacterium]|nr:carboxypeptidase regulatory-like domain-containing protein [Planctomycetota bacterium]